VGTPLNIMMRGAKVNTDKYKDVPGYEDIFSISVDGEVFSKRTKRVLKTCIGKTGYRIISTKIGGRKGVNKCLKIHRLVAMTYIDNPESKPIVNHKDGDKLNNNVNNLEWNTGSQNIKHAYDNGLAKARKGVNSPLSKLSQEHVNFIKDNTVKFCKVNGVRSMAKKFGVHHKMIVEIINGSRYTQI